jgi:thiamine pyrophosphokinase
MFLKVFFLVVVPTLAAAHMECLLIANGEKVPAQLVEELAAGRTVVALDGAVKALREYYGSRIEPAVVLGDFDSCSELDRTHFPNAEVVHVPSQDLGDLEKGITYCDQKEAKAIWIVNALGLDRIDHTLAAFNLLKKHHKSGRRLLLAAEKQIVEFVRDGETHFEGRLGEAVGVFGFPKASVFSNGLHYEMSAYEVEIGGAFSSSNYVAKADVTITIKGEAIVSYPVSHLAL